MSILIPKKNVEKKKLELTNLTEKFKELKSLVYGYKDEKEDEATKSVGEKASPFPLLSVGASVTIFSLEDMWTDSVLRFPK